MKAVVIILSILAFVACMIIGILAANHPLSPPTKDPTSIPNISISPTKQRSLVLISADDLQSPTPHLLGVWLVLYRRDLPQISVIPLYPENSAVDPEEAAHLAEAFDLNSNQTITSGFKTALNALHITWDGYLLSDETGIARLVDGIDGIVLGDRQVNGSGVLANLVNPWEDPQGSLDIQQKTLRAFCEKASGLPSSTDWMALFNELTPRHLVTSLDLNLIVDDWKDLLAGQTPVSCTFPTP